MPRRPDETRSVTLTMTPPEWALLCTLQRRLQAQSAVDAVRLAVRWVMEDLLDPAEPLFTRRQWHGQTHGTTERVGPHPPRTRGGDS